MFTSIALGLFLVAIITVGVVGMFVIAVGAGIWRSYQLHRQLKLLPKSRAYILGPPPPALRDAVEECDTALMAFIEEWRQRFGAEQGYRAKVALQGAVLEFVEGDSFLDNVGRKVRGLTLGRKEAKIAARHKGLGATAFFHEPVHMVLWSLSGEPDPDHEGDAYGAPGLRWTEEHNDMIRTLKRRFAWVEEKGAVEGEEPELSGPVDGTLTCGTCDRVE
jgi:hypothetical protein